MPNNKIQSKQSSKEQFTGNFRDKRTYRDTISKILFVGREILQDKCFFKNYKKVTKGDGRECYILRESYEIAMYVSYGMGFLKTR